MDARAQESTPLIIDGMMYVTAAWSRVFALDAATGALKWSYDPQVPGHTGVNACCDVGESRPRRLAGHGCTWAPSMGGWSRSMRQPASPCGT